jgi:hypothetical protein
VVEYSGRYVGELVRVTKNVLGLSVDVTGKNRAIRLKTGSMFLILSTVENDERAPDIWKTLPLFKILPVGPRTYDDFAMNVKFSAVSIYVDPENVELVGEEEKEII